MALVDSRTGDLELSLKLYHRRELQLDYQQLMTEASSDAQMQDFHDVVSHHFCALRLSIKLSHDLPGETGFLEESHQGRKVDNTLA
jgi:hypothetical protein